MNIFDLELNEVDMIENLTPRKEVVFQLLNEAVRKNDITTQQLRERVECAISDGVEVDPSIIETFDKLSGDALKGN